MNIQKSIFLNALFIGRNNDNSILYKCQKNISKDNDKELINNSEKQSKINPI